MMPDMSVLARLRGVQPGKRGQISGRGLSYCTPTMPHALSSEPKLKAMQTLILGPFFSGGKCVVKGSHRSFPFVELARPKWCVLEPLIWTLSNSTHVGFATTHMPVRPPSDVFTVFFFVFVPPPSFPGR